MTWLAGSAVRHVPLHRLRRLPAWVAVCCAVTLLSCGGSPALEPGEPVTGSLEPGETVELRLDLEPGHFVRLTVEPVAVEAPPTLSLRLRGPDGSTVADEPAIRSPEAGVVAWLTAVGGAHRIELGNPLPLAALTYRLEVLEIREAGPEDVHRVAALRLGAEAARAYDDGRQEDALGHLQSSVDEYEQARDLQNAARVLLNMGQLQWRRDSDQALAYFGRGLEIARRAGVSDPTYWLLDWKAILLARRGDHAAARSAFDEAIEIARAAGDEESAGAEVAIRADRARMERSRGHAELAEEIFEQALARARELTEAGRHSDLLLEKHPELLIELSEFARRRGDLGTASGQLEEAVRLARRHQKRRVEAGALHFLGNVEEQRGHLDTAHAHFALSAELNAALRDRLHEAEARLSLGDVLNKLREPEKARTAFTTALARAEECGSVQNQTRAQLEIGRLWRAEGELDQAAVEFRRGLELAAGLDDNGGARESGLLLYGLGELEIARGDPAAGVQRLQEALAIQRRTQDRAGEMLTLAALGTALGRDRKTAAAIGHLRTALAMAQGQQNRYEELLIRYRLAEVQAAGDRPAALATLGAAIEIGDDIRKGLGSERFRTPFAATTRKLYGLYVDLLMQSGEPALAFAAAEEGRARALLDLLAEARVLRGDLDPELQRQAAAVEERLDVSQRRLSAADGDGALRAALEDEIERAEADLERARAALRDSSPRYRALTAPETLDVEGARALLAARQVALEYWLGPSRSYLFIVTAEGLEVATLPGEPEIRARVIAFRRALEEIEPAAFAEAAHQLYRSLVEPALAAAPAEGIGELTIVPDGALHRLPFEALVTAPVRGPVPFERMPFLVRDHAIGYVPSLSTLSMLDRPEGVAAAEDRGSVIFADSDYQEELDVFCPRGRSRDPLPAGAVSRGTSAVVLPQLRGAREEARRVKARSQPARVYFGAEATEGLLRSRLVAEAGRLHFAVHGLVCESYPERSGLVLTPGPGSEDGFLQMREIYGLELTADLVVLSACDSGAGREVSGEGVVNLARAFFYAGARSVVVSLWKVSDASTAELMDAFYAGLAEGEPYSEALRRAQMRMIASGGRNASPQHWAPFVLIGRAR